MAINIIDPNAPGQAHVDSYWAATGGPEITDAAPVTGDMEVEVAIIGGGYTGLSAALNLAERGYRSVLIDQARIGWGASGRNGGQINTGLRKGPIELIARHGRDRAKAMFDLAEEGRTMPGKGADSSSFSRHCGSSFLTLLTLASTR